MEQRLLASGDNDAASLATSPEQRVPLVGDVLFERADRLPD
jgi:hypothetical protein